LEAEDDMDAARAGRNGAIAVVVGLTRSAIEATRRVVVIILV
jgi:hypothetical protein